MLQQLCLLGQPQRRVEIAGAQRLASRLTTAPCARCDGHEGGQIGTAARARRDSAESGAAYWASHHLPSRKNSNSRSASVAAFSSTASPAAIAVAIRSC